MTLTEQNKELRLSVGQLKRQLSYWRSEAMRFRLTETKKHKVVLSEKVQKIKSIVSDYYGVDMDFVTRHKTHVRARQMYFAYLRHTTSMSLTEIAATLEHRRDHSTIIASLKRHDDYLIYEKDYRIDYDNICTLISEELNKPF
jgi:chromosomal replication initiation ATPase DnaA